MRSLTNWPRTVGPGRVIREDAAPTTTFHKPPRLAADRTALSLFLITLAIAATADYIAFRQVLELVMKTTLTDREADILVAGVTAIALALAHRTGSALRDRSDGTGTGRTGIAAFAALCWAGLGAMAFYIRWIQPQTASGPSVFTLKAGTLPAAAGTSVGTQHPAALLFLMLYLGTGALAIATAYLEHDAARSDYRRARKHLIRVLWRSQQNTAHYALAAGAYDRAVDRKERDRKRYDAILDAFRAHADELKQFVRQSIAARLQDPSATDGLFQPQCPDLDETDGVEA
jgi:hypothetical protein